MSYYQSIFYVLKIILIKLINKYYYNLLANYFSIKKTKTCYFKYFRNIFYYNIKNYIKKYNIYYFLKII